MGDGIGEPFNSQNPLTRKKIEEAKKSGKRKFNLILGKQTSKRHLRPQCYQVKCKPKFANLFLELLIIKEKKQQHQQQAALETSMNGQYKNKIDKKFLHHTIIFVRNQEKK